MTADLIAFRGFCNYRKLSASTNYGLGYNSVKLKNIFMTEKNQSAIGPEKRIENILRKRFISKLLQILNCRIKNLN
jgi:hypothetical protein